MSDEPIANETDLNAWAATSLGALTPASARLDRDALMFRAGQWATGRRSRTGRFAWPAVAASLAMVALGEGALLAIQPGARVVERIVVVHVPAPVPPPVPMPEVAAPVASIPFQTYPLALNETPAGRLAGQLLRYGLDGLPPSPTASGHGEVARSSPATSGRMLDDELRRLRDFGGPL